MHRTTLRASHEYFATTRFKPVAAPVVVEVAGDHLSHTIEAPGRRPAARTQKFGEGGRQRCFRDDLGSMPAESPSPSFQGLQVAFLP